MCFLLHYFIVMYNHKYFINMKSLLQHITEAFTLSRNTKTQMHIDTMPSEKLSKMLYDELHKSKYKLVFGDFKPDELIYEIPKRQFTSDFIKRMNNCFLRIDGGRIFRMSVLNFGALEFSDSPKFCQGEITHHYYNTDFKYYILIKDDKCYLCAYNHIDFGGKDVVGSIFEFTL